MNAKLLISPLLSMGFLSLTSRAHRGRVLIAVAVSDRANFFGKRS